MDPESQQSPPAAECPPLEELACLVDGVLSPERAEATLGHILVCPECYDVYLGLLRFQLSSPSHYSEQTMGTVRTLLPPRPPMNLSAATDASWGKWRPAAAARRLGPVALSLEQLLIRDGLTFDQAREVLSKRYGAEASREKLEILFQALPVPFRRRRLDVEHLASTPSPEPSPELALMARELSSQRAKDLSILRKAVLSLPAEDRLLLNLSFSEGLKISEIARAQELSPKAVYRRREEILRFLREYLRDSGLSMDVFASLFSGSDGGDGADSGGD